MIVDWREIPGRYIKDPRLGHRLGRSYPSGEVVVDEYWDLRSLGTDRDGLVHNGNPDRDYELGDKGFKRVFVLGGSTVMGLGARSNTETICNALEQSLLERFPSVRVANCGVGAYMSWHQLTYLAMEMIGYEPDLIVVLDGHNDFISSTWGNKGLSGAWIPNTHRSLDDIVQLVLEATQCTSFLAQLQVLMKRSPFWKKLSTLFDKLFEDQNQIAKFSNPIWGKMDYSTWSVKKESVDWYIRNVRSTIGLARAHGAQVIYLLQPQIIWGNRLMTKQEEELLIRIGERMPPIPKLGPEWFALAQPRFEALRDEFHDGRNCWIEDASTWLDGIDASVYHDWVHYNALGQRILGERIAQVIQKMWSKDSWEVRRADNGNPHTQLPSGTLTV